MTVGPAGVTEWNLILVPEITRQAIIIGFCWGWRVR